MYIVASIRNTLLKLQECGYVHVKMQYAPTVLGQIYLLGRQPPT